MPLCDSFFGALHIFEYIRIFEYETEQMSHIRIFKKPIFIGHSSSDTVRGMKEEEVHKTWEISDLVSSLCVSDTVGRMKEEEVHI